MKTHPIPVREFPDVAYHLGAAWRPFERNTHQIVLGNSGAGKSHLIRYGILPALGPFACGVVIDRKPGGDRVWRGFGNHVAPADLPCPLELRDRSAMWVVSSPTGLVRGDVEPILEQLLAERAAVLVLDDATTISETEGDRGGMGLGGAIDEIMREGRANGLSAILGLNSPKWAGRGGAKFMAGTYWVGFTKSRDSRDGFADIAGLPADVRGALDPPHMAPRRWLYATDDDETGRHVLALTTAPGKPQDSPRAAA